MAPSRSAVLVVLLTACSRHAFTPSARPMPLSPAVQPREGQGDLQLDGNASGQPLGPSILAGNLRYRRGVEEHVAVTGDLGMLRVDGDQSRENPYAGMARAGVQIGDKLTDGLDVAAFAGIGGGYAPAAGKWLSSDIGAIISGDNRYVRPLVVGLAYASQPFATTTFGVGDEMLRLPRTFGVQGLAGFDLGPRDRSVMLGLALAQLWASKTDVDEARSDVFIGLGGGFRFGAQ